MNFRNHVGTKTWLALSLLSASANAGNEDELFVGNDASLMGGAVVASVRDGGSVWYNPAGLGGTQRDRLDMTTAVYSLQLFQADQFIQADSGEAAELSVQEFVTVPTQISYGRPLTEDLTVGLAYYAPRSSNFIVRSRLQTAGADSGSTWEVDGLLSYAEYVFGGIIGWEPAPGLRVGGGGLLRWDSLTQSVGLFGGASTNDAFDRILQIGRLQTVDRLGIELTGGVQWELTKTLTLGATFRSPRLGLSRSGQRSESTSLAATTFAPTLLEADSSSEELPSEPLLIERLGRYIVGLNYQLGATTLALDADVQPGLSSPDKGIDRAFTWNLRLGWKQQLSKAFALGAGVFTDRSTQGEDEASLITSGGDFYGGSVGIQYDEEHLLAETERADSLIFSSVFALRYAYSSATTEQLTLDTSAADPLEIVSIGETPINVHEFALYVGTGLYF